MTIIHYKKKASLSDLVGKMRCNSCRLARIIWFKNVCILYLFILKIRIGLPF